jgi:hypothetical protein
MWWWKFFLLLLAASLLALTVLSRLTRGYAAER